MSWTHVRETIRNSVSTEPQANRSSSGRGAWRGRSGSGAIGSALRRLHEPTTNEPLPHDFVALLQALESADRQNRG